VAKLNDFRKNNYGDVLRVHYQRLTTDINSLNRFDESLMNNAQVLVSMSRISFSQDLELDEL